MSKDASALGCAVNDHLLDAPQVHPLFRQRAKSVLQIVRAQELPLIVTVVYRSREAQRAMYAQGRTDQQLLNVGFTQEEIDRYRANGYTADKEILTIRVSPFAHGEGLAMDCAWIVDGIVTGSVPRSWWLAYGQAAKEQGLVWGGDWKDSEREHIELNLGQ